MPEFVRHLPFGANIVDRDRIRFRLWAPAQQDVSVQIEGGQTWPMQQRGGWFEAEISCAPGAAYRYRLGSGLEVPDPASRAQAKDVHGPSVVVDPASYRWRHPDWRGRPWHEAVIYELHAGVFGGFAGVQAALPALKALGITAIELMPINDFPGNRNWGYDGVLPFAPDRTYGSPDELKSLIDAAHEQGLMMFLDVVYNHFGPDGNYIASYAPQLFREDVQTPWGPAIDFRRPEVRRFFTENALYWLMEYRFDGLRFDAVHAITEPDWLDEVAAEVRATVEAGRYIHLVLEHDGNVSEHLRRNFDAQWNDDCHHVLHVMLTGEAGGYYEDYARNPAQSLARSLAQGFIYQGEPSAHRNDARRGTPSGDLPPTAFVFFLQNHDQIGNRAFGERLRRLADAEALDAAVALQLLSPHIPLIFMGEEDASPTPFLYFTDHHGELAEAVREGRRREFAKFPDFAAPDMRAKIPDPNAEATFAQSRPEPDPERGAATRALYQRLLSLRRDVIVPRLVGARALGANAIGDLAVAARWRMGDGAILSIEVNLAAEPCPIERPPGQPIFESRQGARESVAEGKLAGRTTVAFLELADG
jgi:maltooligosyltrehalose trehalohydrolase